MKRYKSKQKHIQKTEKGFTIVEVMLAIGISGLMLIGVIGGTYSSIARQRYSDALRNFAEYIRTLYSEVISPQSLGLGNSLEEAILGKVIVFGANPDSNDVYSATLVGKAKIPDSTALSFMEELSSEASNIRIFCGDESKQQNSTLASYTPLWQSEFRQVTDSSLGTNFDNKFVGTLIISRGLTSSAVHTVFLRDITYDLANECTASNTAVSNSLNADFKNGLKIYSTQYAESLRHATGICVKSEDSAIAREVRIAADGRNTSAVHVLDDDGDNKCRN